MTKIHYDQCNIYRGKICKNRPGGDKFVIITIGTIQLKIHYCQYHHYEAMKLQDECFEKLLEQEINV